MTQHVVEGAEGKIHFVADHMPLVAAIGDRFGRDKPFAGLTVAVRIHIEAKTAVLLRTLQRGGAQLVATGNQGTTDDAVAAALRTGQIDVIGSRADDKEAIRVHLDELARRSPDLVLDNGAELIELLVSHPPRGATEETTSGAFRLRRALAGAIPFPVIVINDSPLKAIVENKHGVGQSVVQVLQQATNLLLAHRPLVVFGYGWCGRGIAHYAKAGGARVVVVEQDEIKALEAAIDGFVVASKAQALAEGLIFVTATGETDVITVESMRRMPSGAVIANAGHFDTEIDMVGLRKVAKAASRGSSITRYEFVDEHYVDIIAEGQMVNLAAAGSRGNAIEIMDLGFALQALSLERLATASDVLPPGDQPVPDDINRTVATEMVNALMSRPAS